MSPTLATFVYLCGIAGLFYLDRDKFVKTSKALWLPIVYLLIIGSKPLSVWLGLGATNQYDTQLEGSPIDAAFFTLLLFIALGVLASRGSRTIKFLTTNFPIPVLLYFVFCLVSLIWSDYSGPGIKKWIKAIGDLAMILIVVTDEQPVPALRRLFSRLGFILIPLSLLYIKYYPYLGRAYDPWTGMQMMNGITQDKNLLGATTFIFSLGAVWRLLALLGSDKKNPDRRRHLWAQGILLFCGISLLIYANSATSTVCFTLGAGLMLVTKLSFMRRRPAAIHALIIGLVVCTTLVMVLGGRESAARALGRNPNLTGRTEIWEAIIPMASNPVVGAGFESFWLSPRVKERLAIVIPGLPLNEAHDGYIETYLNLGWVGLALVVFILLDGYRRAVKAFRRDPAFGGLFLAFVLATITYNITEAGFRMLHPTWIFFLLAVMEASGVASGVIVGATPPVTPATEAPAGRVFVNRSSGRGRAPAASREIRPSRLKQPQIKEST